MEAKRIFQEGRKSQMYEVLLRRKILEKLVTTRKGGKVDVLLKAKWPLFGLGQFELGFLLLVAQTDIAS